MTANLLPPSGLFAPKMVPDGLELLGPSGSRRFAVSPTAFWLVLKSPKARDFKTELL
jgi:hypothetical protein